ncbi:ABC transporter substrate-binding protein [Salinisphaera sp.]|uniref:ABC transporter substrate-binding protein n=1 Tax=Salinisphaera sp. TaxID=1914330 RepID=UPI002D76983D|nr:ABC transporter substrate-binding protein [Salinisphaera sp.]HET7314521.1 ABC transporter substrate-binding protein [Salinisphaera sp.]
MANRHILRRGMTIGLSVTAMAIGSTAIAAPTKGTVSVLNWWTSGSEAKSMNILEQMLADQGYKMVNDAVSGGGGSNARTVLKSRIQSGNLPGVAQIKGPQIQQWCNTGLTMNIDPVAEKGNWNQVLPEAVSKYMKCDGHYVAVPFNIHRTNWLWINKSVLDKAGAQMPTDWDSLVAALKKIKQAGITPIAGGGNTWQVATELDAIALAAGGPDFYRKAFVDLDPDALSSDAMIKSLQHLRTIQQYTDPNAQGLSWNHDTGEVVQGEAGMQIMGDWAKGEITNADATPGKEIACIAFPGAYTGYSYQSDSFEMFAHSNSDKNAQYAFARTALSPEFQRKFNKAKGSIPVRQDVSLEGFDACAHKAKKDFITAKKNDALVPTFSQDMAETGAVKGAIFDVIAKFYNNKDMSAEDAAKEMAHRVQQAQAMS